MYMYMYMHLLVMEASGGYECSLVQPDGRPNDCSICLLLLRAPHLVSCCGAHFCGVCISKVLSRPRPACPLCQAAGFKTMLNVGLEREIRQLMVYCPRRSAGCQWAGRVSALEPHSEDDCEYVQVGCRWNCGARVTRRDLQEHEATTCLSRPWYVGIEDKNVRRLADRVESLSAENASLRQSLAEVVAKVSTLESERECLRRDLDEMRTQREHISEVKSAVTELKQGSGLLRAEVEQLKSHQREMAELQHRMTELHTFVKSLDQRLSSRLESVSTRLNDVSQRGEDSASRLDSLQRELGVFDGKQETVDSDSGEQASINPSPTEGVSSASPVPNAFQAIVCTSESSYLTPFVFVVDQCKRRRRSNADYYSLPFLSHEEGYRLCVRVLLNGMGSGRGTHVSVYVYLMRGKNDGGLVWPFRGNIQIHLLNQISEGNNHEQSIDFSESAHPSVASRVTVGERSVRGQGFAQFVSHLDLKFDSVRNRQFLRNDCLRFRVAAVDVYSSSQPKTSVLKRLFT